MSEKFTFWKTMDGTHKLTFVTLILVAVSFPVFLFALMNPKLPTFSRASNPATPPDVVDYCSDIFGNLINNYNFENGRANWSFNKKSTGAFASVDDTYSCAKVARVVMAKNEKAQLFQSKIMLEPNTTYEVSFSAKSSKDRNLNVFVHKHNKPYTNYGLKYTAGLTTEWQTFTTSFTTPAEVDSNSRIRFWFHGRKGDMYWIDNVVLKKAVAINPVNFETPYAKLNSSNFYIRIGGKYFYSKEPIYTHSDPGNTEYTTLENTWNENGVEMRLFMYFKTLPENSHTRWRLYEVRTYDGNPRGEWIYYNPTGGHVVESEIGSPNYLDPRYFVPTDGSDAEIFCEQCTIIPNFNGTNPVDLKRVFVTSNSYNGNLGDLSGADAKCQTRADEADLGGTWKAWLSDSSGALSPANNRFTHSSSPYVRIDGAVVANNWNDLTDGTLDNPINITELGLTANINVWTNTNFEGNTVSFGSHGNCVDFNSSNPVNFSNPGTSNFTDGRWTVPISPDEKISCDILLGLYCFEQ